MNIIFILLPLSIILGGIFLIAYLWAASGKQFEDLNTPAIRILADEDEMKKEK